LEIRNTLAAYAIFLIPLGIYHHHLDNPNSARLIRLIGPIQKHLLKDGFDFSKTKQLLKTSWRGPAAEFFFKVLNWSETPFYAALSSEVLRPGIIHGFDIDALVNSSMVNSEEFQLTQEHLFKRVETSHLKKDKSRDILVVRFDATGNNELDNKIRKEMAHQIKAALLKLGAGPLHGRMSAYLENSVIVVEPRGVIKPSQILQQAQTQLGLLHITDVRFDLYTAAPDQFDMNDPLVNFIVYALIGGLKVLPISIHLNNAGFVSTHA
jgi:hypothetical protein